VLATLNDQPTGVRFRRLLQSRVCQRQPADDMLHTRNNLHQLFAVRTLHVVWRLGKLLLSAKHRHVPLGLSYLHVRQRLPVQLLASFILQQLRWGLVFLVPRIFAYRDSGHGVLLQLWQLLLRHNLVFIHLPTKPCQLQFVLQLPDLHRGTGLRLVWPPERSFRGVLQRNFERGFV